MRRALKGFPDHRSHQDEVSRWKSFLQVMSLNSRKIRKYFHVQKGTWCLPSFSSLLSQDGKFYPARITSIGGSPTSPIYTIVFKSYDSTEQVSSSDLKPLKQTDSTNPKKRTLETSSSTNPSSGFSSPLPPPPSSSGIKTVLHLYHHHLLLNFNLLLLLLQE